MGENPVWKEITQTALVDRPCFYLFENSIEWFLLLGRYRKTRQCAIGESIVVVLHQHVQHIATCACLVQVFNQLIKGKIDGEQKGWHHGFSTLSTASC